MVGTRTAKYKIYKPEVGAEADLWGNRTNEGWNDVDALAGATATTGSANAYVLASGLTTALSAYVTGQTFLIIPNFTNSGAATLNVDGLGIIRALNPVAFNFIGFDKRQGGFLAHEVQALIPEAVHGEKDAVEPLFSVFDANRVRVIGPVDAREAGVLAAAVYMQGGAFEPDGTRLVSQGLDMAKIVPYAVAALQSIAARVEALEAA